MWHNIYDKLQLRLSRWNSGFFYILIVRFIFLSFGTFLQFSKKN